MSGSPYCSRQPSRDYYRHVLQPFLGGTPSGNQQQVFPIIGNKMAGSASKTAVVSLMNRIKTKNPRSPGQAQKRHLTKPRPCHKESTQPTRHKGEPPGPDKGQLGKPTANNRADTSPQKICEQPTVQEKMLDLVPREMDVQLQADTPSNPVEWL